MRRNGNCLMALGHAHAAFGRPVEAEECYRLAHRNFMASFVPLPAAEARAQLLRRVILPYRADHVDERRRIEHDIIRPAYAELQES